MVEVLSLKDAIRWKERVFSMNEYDFYHLPEYHFLDHAGTPLLFYYETEGIAFALPVVLRLIDGTEYTDVTSVYGYCGPLSNTQNPGEEYIADFQDKLSQFFDSRNVVSVFSRLHPLFAGQKALLSGMGNIADLNTTVGMDLTLTEAEQRAQYGHSLKYELNRLKRNHAFVKKPENREEVDAFVSIYEENMKRVNAHRMYFFSNEYFYRFLESVPSVMLLAVLNEEIIGGTLFSMCNGIMQVHLSATKTEYLHWSPNKMVWDEARKIGVINRLKYMHLGGGFGGKNDSLFFFKSRFSKLHFTFSVWKYIHNENVYNELLFQKHGHKTPEISFFPGYRG